MIEETVRWLKLADDLDKYVDRLFAICERFSHLLEKDDLLPSLVGVMDPVDPNPVGSPIWARTLAQAQPGNSRPLPKIPAKVVPLSKPVVHAPPLQVIAGERDQAGETFELLGVR
jgi:hypothetical protein